MLAVFGVVGTGALEAQAVDLTVTDSAGLAIRGAAAQLLTHASTNPVLVDSIFDQRGRTLIRVPSPYTSAKLYVVKTCAPHFAPQFVTAPFGVADTLRVTVRLARLKTDTLSGRGPCDGSADWVSRATINDTSSFIGLAAAGNIEVEWLNAQRDELLDKNTGEDSAQAATNVRHVLAKLDQRIGRAHTPSERARAAHQLVSFAFSTHSALDASTRARVLAALPPTSRWWSSTPYVVAFGLELLFTPRAAKDDSVSRRNPATKRPLRRYVERMATSIDEPEIQSEARSWLVRLAYMDRDTSRAQSILAQMLAETPNQMPTVAMASMYAPNRPLRKGATMPAFEFSALPDTSRRVTNRDIAGKYTLIDFWGTWCGPCMRAIPELHRIYKTYHDRGFEILSIAADATPETVNRFRAEKWPMPWLNGFAEYGEGTKDNPKLQALWVQAYPVAVLVDPHGQIVAMYGPELEDLASTLDRLLTH